MIRKYTLLSGLHEIEEDHERKATLAREIRILEGMLPNVTLENISDAHSDHPPESSALADAGNNGPASMPGDL